MRSRFYPHACPLFQSLCALMLSFALAVSPAFALPKSPFLGMNDDSAPQIQLLERVHFVPDSSLPRSLQSPYLQISASNASLYSIQQVALFHGLGEGAELFAVLGLIMFIGPFLAIGGQLTDHHTVRNVGNVMSYPWLVIPPVFGILGSVELQDSAFLIVGGIVTTIGLLMATAGQIADGGQKMRNIGNWTYLGGLVLMLPNIYFLL